MRISIFHLENRSSYRTEYLKMVFGDYMQLPAPPHRMPHHDMLHLNLEKAEY